MSKEQIHPRHLSSINKQLSIDKHISMDTPLQQLEGKCKGTKEWIIWEVLKHINWSRHIAHLERGGADVGQCQGKDQPGKKQSSECFSTNTAVVLQLGIHSTSKLQQKHYVHR